MKWHGTYRCKVELDGNASDLLASQSLNGVLGLGHAWELDDTVVSTAGQGVRSDIPDGGIVAVNVGVHDVVAGNSTKVLEILGSCQDMKEYDHETRANGERRIVIRLSTEAIDLPKANRKEVPF